MTEPRIVSREEIMSWDAGPLPPRRKARILVDEQMSRHIVETLKRMKARVYYVADMRTLRGRSDEEVAHHAVKHGLILMTINARDFGDRMRFPIERMPFTVILPVNGGKGDDIIINSLGKVLWFVLSYPRYDKEHKRIRVTARGDGMLLETHDGSQRVLELYLWDSLKSFN